MLTINNLSKKFGSTVAVWDLSLKIGKGEIYALIGPNGAGKTTTIKIIVGLYLPDRGSVEFLGHDLLEKSCPEKKLIGYIPDEPFFYPGLTGMEIVNFTSALYGVSEEEKNKTLTKFSKIFPLKEILSENPENYSRGNKQKLAICTAFLGNPKLLLVDEPIVGLDPESAQAALDLFIVFAKDGGSILVSTHTLAAAEKIASRVGIIDKGKLIADGNLEDLRRKTALKAGHLEDIFLKITHEKE